MPGRDSVSPLSLFGLFAVTAMLVSTQHCGTRRETQIGIVLIVEHSGDLRADGLSVGMATRLTRR